MSTPKTWVTPRLHGTTYPTGPGWLGSRGYGWPVIRMSVTLWRAGWTFDQISKHLGPHPSTIRGWVESYQADPARYGGGRMNPDCQP